MPSVFVKCTECKFTRHVQLMHGKLIGAAGEAVLKHAYSKGHILQIGSFKYKSIGENEIGLCEDPQKKVVTEVSDL